MKVKSTTGPPISLSGDKGAPGQIEKPMAFNFKHNFKKNFSKNKSVPSSLNQAIHSLSSAQARIEIDSQRLMSSLLYRKISLYTLYFSLHSHYFTSGHQKVCVLGWGSAHTNNFSKSLRTTECPIIQLDSNTIYLDLSQALQVKCSVPQECPQF